MADLKDLLERVEKATGPDRELECRLFAAMPDMSMLEGVSIDKIWAGADGAVYYTQTDRRGTYFISGIPNYTASIDAALALCERKLGKFMWAVGDMEDGPFARLVVPLKTKRPDNRPEWAVWEGHAATPPLALLRALIEQEKQR